MHPSDRGYNYHTEIRGKKPQTTRLEGVTTKEENVNNLINTMPKPKKASYYDTTERDGYLSALSAQMSAQRAAYDNMLNLAQQQYDATQKKLAGDRENAKRNAYIASQVAEKNLPLELAENGINGGLAETSLVRLKTALGRNLANADMQYNDDINAAYRDMLKAKAAPAGALNNLNASFATAQARAPKPKKVTTNVYDKSYMNGYAQTLDWMLRNGWDVTGAINDLNNKGVAYPG